MNITPVSIAVCNQKGGVGNQPSRYCSPVTCITRSDTTCWSWTATIPSGRSMPSANGSWRPSGTTTITSCSWCGSSRLRDAESGPSSAACPPKRFGRSTASCKAATARGSSSTTSRERSMPKELSPASHRSFIKRPFLAF